MEKKKYMEPEVEIIIFETQDIITTSGMPEGEDWELPIV